MAEHRRPNDRTRLNGRTLRPGNGHSPNGRFAHGPRASSFTLRDLLTIGFRRRRVVLLSCLCSFALASLFVLLRPAEYESEMKILVKRERVDPLVTSEASSQQPLWPGVSEEELNSEVELLKSRDLLGRVVRAAGFDKVNGSGIGARLRTWFWGAEAPKEEERKVAIAVQQFEQRLQIQPLRRSNIIRVTFASPRSNDSVAALKALAAHYMDKHLSVHRPSGAFDFFERETARYGGQLALAQARLRQENEEAGVVSVQPERDAVLKLLGDLQVTEVAAGAQIVETSERIRVLQRQLVSTPARTTSEIHRGSARLLEQLYSTLVTHELKRIELLRAFQPDYPPVQEIDDQIAKIKAAIASAEQSPLVEETTGRNPTHDHLLTELEKNRTELAALHARAAATARGLSTLQDKARRLERVGLAQQELVRTVAQAEQNYNTYSRKREEARIANELDDQRILNVAIAEEATVPFEPSGPPRSLLLLLAALACGLLGVIVAFVVDYLDPSFRTPDEVQMFLGVPVIAAIPQVRALPELPGHTGVPHHAR